MTHVQVLGPLAAQVAGAEVDLGGPRQRAVLARLLAVHGEVVSVDRLIEDLWRGEPPPKAIASLQAYVSNLRRLLEPGRGPRAAARVLISASPGYAVRLATDDVDAWRFERLLREARDSAESEPARARVVLAEALGLWRGDAFAEVADEPWAAAEAARLRELRLVARELHVEVSLRTGDAAEAVPAAEVLTRQQPLREQGWRLLTLALWACDRQADALAALRRAKEILADELGLDPGPALASLESDILAQRVEVLRAALGRNARGAVTAAASGPPAGPSRVAPAPAAPPPDPGTADAPPVTRETPFVGRHAELAHLRAVASDARAHGTRIALIAGEAGVGKSSLLGQLRGRLLDDGWTVVAGRCPETEDAPPAWAWTEALRDLAAAHPPGDLNDAVSPLLGGDTTSGGDPATGRFRLHAAVSEWLRRAAMGRPLAVFLDDLHDADAETLALLTHLAPALSGFPALVVTAFRTAEGRPRLTDTLAVLARHHPYRLHLDGLAEADAERLLTVVHGGPIEPATVKALSARTGGNPFYLRESARLLAAEGALVAVSEVPEGVRDVLRRRTARLPPAAVSVLRLAAVVGREADVEVLIAAADTDEEGVLDACEAGLIAGLLDEPAPGRVRFVHALVRDTMYTDLSALRRTRMHARVADAMRRLHPDDLTALAHHYTSAASSETAPLAVEYCVRAAQLAEHRYASDTEVALLSQALSSLDRVRHDPDRARDVEAERIDLMGRLLRAQVRAGAIAAARDTRDQAVRLAQRASRDDLLLAAFTAWTEPTPWLTHTYGQVDDEAAAAIASLLRRDDLAPADRCRLLAALSSELEGSPDPRVESAAAEAVTIARELDDPALLALALSTRARATTSDRDPDLWAELSAEIRRLGVEHDMPQYRWYAEHLDSRIAAARNDVPTMLVHVQRGLDIAMAYEMAEPEAVTRAAEAMMALVAGRYAEAERRFAEVGVQMARHGSLHTVGFRAMARGVTLVTQHRAAEAGAMFEPLLSMFPVAADTVALGLAEAGEPDRARAIRATAPRLQPDYFHSLFATLRGMAVVALGERDAAGGVIEELLPYRDQLAGAASTSLALRPVAHVLGDLCRMLGREEEAIEHYRTAAQVARRWGGKQWEGEAEAALHVVDK